MWIIQRVTVYRKVFEGRGGGWSRPKPSKHTHLHMASHRSQEQDQYKFVNEFFYHYHMSCYNPTTKTIIPNFHQLGFWRRTDHVCTRNLFDVFQHIHSVKRDRRAWNLVRHNPSTGHRDQGEGKVHPNTHPRTEDQNIPNLSPLLFLRIRKPESEASLGILSKILEQPGICSWRANWGTHDLLVSCNYRGNIQLSPNYCHMSSRSNRSGWLERIRRRGILWCTKPPSFWKIFRSSRQISCCSLAPLTRFLSQHHHTTNKNNDKWSESLRKYVKEQEVGYNV